MFRRQRLILVLGVVFLPIFAIPASAHHDGTELWGSNWDNVCDRTPQSQCVANNTLHLYQLNSNLSTARENATLRALNLYSTNSEVSAVANSDDEDVYITFANRMDVNAFAWGQCAPQPAPPLPDPVSFGGSEAAHTRWCRPQWIYWNTWTSASSKVDSTAKYNYIGCHEVGHTLGLRHRGTTASCMIAASSGPFSAGSVVPTSQSPAASDYDRIDNHYPIP